MKRYLLYQTIFFLVISLTGVTLSLYFMKDALESLYEIQQASTSMARRSALYREVEKMEKDMSYLPEGLKKVSQKLQRCKDCHGTEEHRKAIYSLSSVVNDLKEAYRDNRPIEALLKSLHELANKAALKGEEHILEEATEVSYRIKTWGVFSGAIILILFGGFVAISLILQKRASHYIRGLINATEAIAEGKRLSPEPFREEFKPVGEALQRMQAQIKASEEKLQNWVDTWQKSFDTIEEMIAVCDSRGILVQANRAFKRTFGRNIEGKPFNALVNEVLKADLSQEIAKTLTMTERPLGEINTEKGYYRWTIYPMLGLKEDITGFIWICRDATKEKQLEERALQAEKLVALGELVAGIAHELNNPLSVVVGYAEMLRGMELPEEANRRATRIFEAAERAAGIVRALLDISKKRPPKVEKTRIEPLIKTILELMDYEFRSDGIEVETLFQDTPVVEVDPIHIKQIAINLLKNAHDAVLENPEHRKIWVSTYVQDGYLCFQVRDNGPGIPEEIKHRIFEPFFTTKDVGKGTGLGLYSVYNLVMTYGGDVAVFNHSEGGAVFTVRLPLKDQQSRA